MKKTVYFFSVAKTGGAEMVTRTFYKFLDKKRFNSKFIIAGKHEEIDQEPFQKTVFLEIKDYKYSFFKLNSILRKNNIDYIFCSVYGISIPLLLLSFFHRKIKVIVRHSFMPDYYKKFSFLSYILMLSYSNAYKIIAQTEEMKLSMIDYYRLKPADIVVMHNPIDWEKIKKGIKEENPYKDENSLNHFVTVGNIRYVKGFDSLIKAFKVVVDEIPASRLHIIGRINVKDDYYNELLRLIRINGLDEKIEFVGFVSNPYPYIYYADCFVLSSRTEGLPNALLEAYHLKKKIVATKCIPIIEKIINDGANGFSVEVDDYKEMGRAMIGALAIETKYKDNYQPSTAKTFNALFQ